MTYEYQLRLLPEQAANEQSITQCLATEKGLDLPAVNAVRVLKRSIDARQRTIYVNLHVRAYVNEMPPAQEYTPVEYHEVDGRRQAVVVGAGPGGLFAALRLIEQGIKEGGAGAYSDGKLYTRSKKRGDTDRILRIFCQHGASTAILADAHPHIGTDKLPRVIENMRRTILQCGGEIHFQTRADALIVRDGQAIGVQTAGGQEFHGPVILATGHSARDVYRWLHAQRIAIEPKGIAVGVRLEHPQELIDQIQYHRREGRGEYLPAAEYSFVTQADGRGVYSFCMCPGGFVVPAASGPEQVVVNGMSPSNRGSRWANSGMVVETRPEDITGYEQYGALALLHFQEDLERQAWLQGGRSQTAPAQRMADFVTKRLGASLPDSSYTPGLVASPLHFWLPGFISERLRQGFRHFGKASHGFLTNQAAVIGVETRTSSPVRILRDRDTLQHVEIQGLFPCGEGAGYAGGIVSAGIDGERCADSLSQYLNASHG